MACALNDGRYARGQVSANMSPAMDIQIASNFERLYFEAVARESTETGRAFKAFADVGRIDIPPAAQSNMKGLFSAMAVSEAETAKTILATLNDTGEVIDPHTAVAVAAARKSARAGGAPLIALSTAHPAKFPEAVLASAKVEPPAPAIVRAQAKLPERIDKLPANAESVKAYVRQFAGV
jgi:threonine synthase